MAGLIQLAVVVLHAAEEHSAPDPVSILTGGPGEAATPLVPLVGATWHAMAGARDLVLVDQRGTGFSQPNLDCHEPVTECRARLLAEGVDLSTYTTARNAADFEAVRLALGYAEISLIGGSYGTHLGLAILRDYPAGVRSAVLDGVVPPMVHLDPAMMRAFARSLRILFAECAAAVVCQAAFPALEQILYLLVPRLDETPIQVETAGRNRTIDGHAFIELLFEALHHSDTLPYLPCLIGCTANGDARVLEALAGALWGGSGARLEPGAGDLISEGMQYSVLCAEEAAYQSPEEFQAAAAEFDAAIRDTVLDSCLYFERLCETWAVPAGPTFEEQPVVSDVPALLLSGRYDPACSPEWARAAAETLSHHFLYEYPRTGHVVHRTSECARGLIRQFIEDPWQAPDTACVHALGPPDFVMRAP